ncbi:hypothetical protein ACN47E_009714 [Coniothyrium glycines]
MDYSPATSVTSEMTDEELDNYFASYVPLSNLPTPPPVKEHAIPRSAPQPSIAAATTTTTTTTTTRTSSHSTCSQSRVDATHLANLVPLNVSTHHAHASVIEGFLERASLPEEIVAFCACVLDALSARFATTWRNALAQCHYERDLGVFLRTDSRQNAHVGPEVIVLAALSLAHGFLVDRIRSSKHWSVREAAGAFSVQEIEASKRAILCDMNYGLFRIKNEMVQQRLRDMQRTIQAQTTGHQRQGIVKPQRQRNLSLSFAGAAIWSEGGPTPEPSP